MSNHNNYSEPGTVCTFNGNSVNPSHHYESCYPTFTAEEIKADSVINWAEVTQQTKTLTLIPILISQVLCTL